MRYRKFCLRRLKLQFVSMPTQLDQTMEVASIALAKMDYLACEDLCFAALAQARERGDWAYYSAILLPLQEARRQRRMIAAEGIVRLGTAKLAKIDAQEILSQLPAGCVVLTSPHTPADAHKLAISARQKRQHVEVLFAQPDDGRWLLRSFAPNSNVSCSVAAPPAELLERWLKPGEMPAAADWFLDACEMLGDAALAAVKPVSPTVKDLARMEACLDIVTDHEQIHQQLGSLARALVRAG